MDKIQRELIKAGRRDLAQEYFLRVQAKTVNKNSEAYKRGLKDGNEKTGRPFLDGVKNYRYEVGTQECIDYKAGHSDAY